MKKLVRRRRTEEEKRRRSKFGDKGALFSKGKEFFISDSPVADTITTFIIKENLIYEDTAGDQ